ncbi:TetR family transcriptional regulator [Herbihabitans rhizosphaerae]|uniref:TetR family transcriptional regulator n=1 Tax=Herbihabitans rhizosphaerae TaxID=1872711 RepID=A0A4Q7L6S2_9PSEU|nr:TetR/AcrR family transcriptional regulator [Herbihabitans rhizosphaerae]RZS45057.1 TetR family transcriptional regulator [Herbihabitans rhizosphaerae]
MARSGRLTPAAIVTAALRLGDREGAEAMSMRRIAAAIECDPMALYRHFTNREALLDAVADAALTDAQDPGPDTPWSERLHTIMAAIRSSALRHPGIAAHIAARPPLGENGRRLGAGIFAALTEAGLAPPDVVRASQTLIAHLAAALAMSVRAGRRDARWEQVSQTITQSPGAPPGEHLFIVGSDEQFEYGLRLLVNGIRAEAAG